MNNPISNDAMHSLYTAHHQWLFQWLIRRLRCTDDAADLSHDTYVRIFSSGRMPEKEDDCRPFLMQVAKGLVVDLHRKRTLEQSWLEALASLPEPCTPSAEHRQMMLELLISIDQALDELPEKVRETFLLSRFEGLTYSAIAQKLGVSVGSVRKYMMKASLACFMAINEADEGLVF